MKREVKIIMYHYIRDLKLSRYPRIKARTTSDFKAQIGWLKKNHSIITMQELIHSIRTGDNPKPNAVLLTFDDGYIDHFTTVFPILFDLGLQGSFFPPVAVAQKGELLDVNRIHFLLAEVNVEILAAEIDRRIHEYSGIFALKPVTDYRRRWSNANRFDDAETIYVKRMLQHVLPEDFRKLVARDLFSKYIAIDEKTFAAELYLNTDQLRVMQSSGMYIGAHGSSHYWFDTLGADELNKEIACSLKFLNDLGGPVDDFWVMCYPYGAHNRSVVEALKLYGCTVGLTTEVAVADLDRHDHLLLPRLDTNDLSTGAHD